MFTLSEVPSAIIWLKQTNRNTAGIKMCRLRDHGVGDT